MTQTEAMQARHTVRKYTDSPLPAELVSKLNDRIKENNQNHSVSIKLITGDELLSLALDKIREAQGILGGKVVYVECEDVAYLKDFYQSNGFVIFGKRPLDKDEKTDICGDYLMQLLKYIK